MTRDNFVAAVLINADGVRAYKIGYDGQNPQGWCDCIGLIKGAFAIAHETLSTSGVNWSARHDIDDLRAFDSISELKLGDVVLKVRNPGESGYNLPEKYRNDPDQKDYYHIGVVTNTTPLRITHCTTVDGGIKVDTSKSNWKYKGRLKAVSDEQPSGGGNTNMIKALVIASQGNNVNLRAQPSKTSQVLIQVPLNKEVDLIEEGPVWSQVQYQEIKGYMMSEFLMPIGEVDNGPVEGEPGMPDGGGYVTIRMPEDLAYALWEILDGTVGRG